MPEVHPGPAAQFDALACVNAPWPCDEAYRVWTCESGWWGAVSPDGQNWGGFQINLVHLDKVEALTGSRDPSLLLDPAINIVIAQQIYADQGWGPWSCRPGG